MRVHSILTLTDQICGYLTLTINNSPKRTYAYAQKRYVLAEVIFFKYSFFERIR